VLVLRLKALKFLEVFQNWHAPKDEDF
jgi:hypothetical protein